MGWALLDVLVKGDLTSGDRRALNSSLWLISIDGELQLIPTSASLNSTESFDDEQIYNGPVLTAKFQVETGYERGLLIRNDSIYQHKTYM